MLIAPNQSDSAHIDVLVPRASRGSKDELEAKSFLSWAQNRSSNESFVPFLLRHEETHI